MFTQHSYWVDYSVNTDPIWQHILIRCEVASIVQTDMRTEHRRKLLLHTATANGDLIEQWVVGGEMTTESVC